MPGGHHPDWLYLPGFGCREFQPGPSANAQMRRTLNPFDTAPSRVSRTAGRSVTSADQVCNSKQAWCMDVSFHELVTCAGIVPLKNLQPGCTAGSSATRVFPTAAERICTFDTRSL
eukprot:GHUV01048159.1.p1 GENE.GHUV01048159.1~~GHUV01048159.1.p1  ORF type:complete len:116 (-),score=14.89 GHUV01048159.1:74-421(-)